MVKKHTIPNISGVSTASSYIDNGRHYIILNSNGTRQYCVNVFISSNNITSGIIGTISDSSFRPSDTVRFPVYNYNNGSGKLYFLTIENTGTIKISNINFAAPTISDGNLKIFATFVY